MLDKVSSAVVGLYLDDQTDAQRGISKVERNKKWDEVARKNPVFEKEILGLKEALEVANNIKETHTTNMIIGISFSGLYNKTAGDLLSDILLSRKSPSADYIHRSSLELDELGYMAAEMGFTDWESSLAKGVSAKKVVKKVLEGKLRVKYQPEPAI